jgi:hypothetical protein
MIPHYVYYQLAILGLLWFCIMLSYLWPSRGAVSPQPPAGHHDGCGKNRRRPSHKGARPTWSLHSENRSFSALYRA